jgi:putative DNA primase/helicase
LEDHREIRVILIEPVVAYVNPKDGSSEPEIRRKLRPLAKLAQHYQLAIIGIMHFRKSGDAATPIHMIAGSLAYGAVARVAYAVVKDKNDPDRRLFLTMGNNLAKGDLGFAYRIEEVRVDRQIAATAIAWEGAVEITAEEALTKDAKEAVNKIDAAEAWLRSRLMPGLVPAKQIEDEVKAMGLWSLKTVERAADNMGVTKQKDGFQSVSVWAYKPGA